MICPTCKCSIPYSHDGLCCPYCFEPLEMSTLPDGEPVREGVMKLEEMLPAARQAIAFRKSNCGALRDAGRRAGED